MEIKRVKEGIIYARVYLYANVILDYKNDNFLNVLFLLFKQRID